MSGFKFTELIEKSKELMNVDLDAEYYINTDFVSHWVKLKKNNLQYMKAP